MKKGQKQDREYRLKFTHSCISTDISTDSFINVCGNTGMGEYNIPSLVSVPFFIPNKSFVNSSCAFYGLHEQIH